MINMTESNLRLILIGLYLFISYFNMKFKGFLVMSILCILPATLYIFNIVESKVLQLIIFIFLAAIAMLIWSAEAEKFKIKKEKIFHYTKKNIIFLIALIGIYILSKIYYFDKLGN